MLNLLYIELIKFFYRKSFYYIFALYILTLFITEYRFIEYKYDGESLIYVLDTFKIILIIPFVLNITSEFSQNTIHQSLINGLSRWQILLSKLLLGVFISAIATLITKGLVLFHHFCTGQDLPSQENLYLLIFFFKWICFFVFFTFLSFCFKQSIYCVGIWALVFIIEYILQSTNYAINPFIDILIRSSHRFLPINAMQILMEYHNGISIAQWGQIIICVCWSSIWIFLSDLCLKRDF